MPLGPLTSFEVYKYFPAISFSLKEKPHLLMYSKIV